MIDRLRDMSLYYADKKFNKYRCAMSYRYENDFYTAYVDVPCNPYTYEEFYKVRGHVLVIEKDNHPITSCTVYSPVEMMHEMSRLKFGYLRGIMLDGEMQYTEINDYSDVLYREAKLLVNELDRIIRCDFPGHGFVPRESDVYVLDFYESTMRPLCKKHIKLLEQYREGQRHG